MATISEGGLFPPIIDAYLPAKPIIGGGAGIDDIRIPFDINYNDISDVHEVHISLIRQTNYHSALISNYPTGVYITNEITQDSGNIYHTILPFDRLNKQEEISYNEYYKLQIRLSRDTHGTGKTGKTLSEYLSDETNLTKFSEWSTVCLIRFIAQPQILLDCNGQSIESSVTIDTTQVMITGRYGKVQGPPYGESALLGSYDKEYLYSYKFIVRKTGSNERYESKDIIVDRQNPNKINYTLPYYFTNGNYFIEFQYTTANLYQDSLFFFIGVSINTEAWGTNTKVLEAVATDNVIGKVNISFQPKDRTPKEIPAGSKFIIRRGNDTNNFTIWDTVFTKTLTTAVTDSLSFDDFTIESGVLYKYEITFVDPTNHHIYTITEGPVMSVFDHAFLTGEGTQLCVKFNPEVSSYKINTSDSIITTIGGKYPFVKRNGDMYYRTFSLSGSIAYEMDVQHQFATRSSIYGDWMQVYGSYFVNHYFNQRNDRVTQRKFRELVMDYLYNDEPKLFRSTPEGNILVRLTDVNLSPKNELGRMIYDFSCTATEIGDPSVENYKMYKIQDFGDK